MIPILTPAQLLKIDELLYEGRKIEAIKLYRNFTHCELIEGKRFIDMRSSELQKLDPTRFQRRPSGCIGIIIILLTLTASLVFISRHLDVR